MTKGSRVERKELACAEIVWAKRLAVREASKQTVRAYRQAMESGAEFPPVTVALINGTHYLVDGQHRLQAAKDAGEPTIQAVVHKVTWEKASSMAAVANTAHGRPLSTKEKSKALQAFLRDRANDKLSLQEVVDALGGTVSRSSVRNHRERMKGSGLRGSDALTAEELEELQASRAQEQLRAAAEKHLRGLSATFIGLTDPDERRWLLDEAKEAVERMEAEGNLGEPIEPVDI